MIPFDLPPRASEVPARMPNPLDGEAPHPLARHAAEELQARLRMGRLPAGVAWDKLDLPGQGKMFGVLVVEDRVGAIGYLQGFSGMVDSQWEVPGFAPPVFDAAVRDAVWIPGEAELFVLAERLAAASGAGRAELKRARAARSRELLEQVQDSYRLVNARGERSSLRALFAPDAPPGGAGDCAAPKLLAQAYRERLRPVALAEFWWGGSPPADDRQTGRYYPACRRSCARILPYMLQGLAVDAAQ